MKRIKISMKAMKLFISAYFMCDNPSIVCHLVSRILKMQRPFRAQKKGSLHPCNCCGGISDAAKFHEGYWTRAPGANVEESQTAEAGAAVTVRFILMPIPTPRVFSQRVVTDDGMY